MAAQKYTHKGVNEILTQFFGQPVRVRTKGSLNPGYVGQNFQGNIHIQRPLLKALMGSPRMGPQTALALATVAHELGHTAAPWKGTQNATGGYDWLEADARKSELMADQWAGNNLKRMIGLFGFRPDLRAALTKRAIQIMQNHSAGRDLLHR